MTTLKPRLPTSEKILTDNRCHFFR